MLLTLVKRRMELMFLSWQKWAHSIQTPMECAVAVHVVELKQENETCNCENVSSHVSPMYCRLDRGDVINTALCYSQRV